MPHVYVTIIDAWRYRNERRRIHYTVCDRYGHKRHLYVDEGNALYDLLEGHLAARSYTGPKPKRGPKIRLLRPA